MTQLPVPATTDVEAWVEDHLLHLSADERVDRSPRFAGTQAAADDALAALDISGYARRRSEVLPESARGASGLSPYIRHGMLTLPAVSQAVGAAPSKDRQKFRDELMWQEYARHVYARLGTRTARSLRFAPPARTGGASGVEPWDRSMACIDATVGELERDGWLVNQTRMWLASQWTVRHGADWRVGEDRFFTHLLDGSRAANRLGWQWTIGAGTGKPYGFSRWQVEKRAPGLCARCPHRHDCPIEHWPDERSLAEEAPDDRLRRDLDPDRTAGPTAAPTTGGADTIWLTAESLGDDDPALAAHPELPVVFVFDEPLLARLRLASKRLVFLADRLAELATRRPVELHLGDPGVVLAGRALATTFTPVPKGRALRHGLHVAELHPWPWLVRPNAGSIESFSAWRRSR
ncbi:MAG TPA: FAD-binding domain-containing protein [Ilumatobacteraceae bacterium]|nr:FAD-binding domain-containing protein [Ilumatobacteraceae bacterium]